MPSLPLASTKPIGNDRAPLCKEGHEFRKESKTMLKTIAMLIAISAIAGGCATTHYETSSGNTFTPKTSYPK